MTRKEPYKNETAFKFEEFKLITNTLALEVAESGLRTFAPNIYKFPKVDEPHRTLQNWENGYGEISEKGDEYE